MPQRTHSTDDAIAEVGVVDPGNLVAENQSLREKLLRALADAENTRRRAERSADDARRYSIADFAREMLSVSDNLRRAIAASDSHPGDSNSDAGLLQGVRSTERMLMQALERFGVSKIEALGKPFEPSLHEAVMETDDPERPPGTVAEVLEDGYTISDRLLRPARVAVVKQRAKSTSVDDDMQRRNHQP